MGSENRRAAAARIRALLSKTVAAGCLRTGLGDAPLE